VQTATASGAPAASSPSRPLFEDDAPSGGSGGDGADEVELDVSGALPHPGEYDDRKYEKTLSLGDVDGLALMLSRSVGAGAPMPPASMTTQIYVTSNRFFPVFVLSDNASPVRGWRR
jgi:hypothetical protein